MIGNNRLSTSFGLIVKTECGRVVIIKRKVPYCIQNYFHYLHKIRNKPKDFEPVKSFKAVQSDFERNWLPKLTDLDRMEYQKFLDGRPYEDLYDFPHGQLTCKSKIKNRRQMFQEAYREFKEESGFKFKFKISDIENYPLFKLQFWGLDNCLYTQYYFIVDNVKGLKRITFFDSYTGQDVRSTPEIESWTDDRLVYHGQLIRREEAFKLLQNQQEIKYDLKHLFCLKEWKVMNEKLKTSLVSEKKELYADKKSKPQNIKHLTAHAHTRDFSE